ncbi:aromatic ring-hydroxylating dioxygenase subunit alpha [Sandaracinobacter sp. RS1-74]|uniref:aromatic ring-hydroxylating oxygenase subunit alpha n=1 Tax=Sandaracinobacteroides sayramensis TaxID=2913411 RepID=UPI001EDA9FE1|nr:aromatic ring-hydroxylating dioxygenase subunit alpha [Sandaracinobacteroides sayramensis]MCG2840550.1 aromatic ring-hydroxylating dioxygenase subunit alpha [Sandaracinobacteroides sayramensis]
MADADAAGGREAAKGVSWFELAKADTGRIPDHLVEDHYQFLGSEPLDVARYTSPEFFRREIEQMWPHVWQYAAREEELLNPGDSVVYENAGRSYVLVRQADNSVRAFHNVCLHRGRKLRQRNGRLGELRCPYHAFSWNLDGTLKNIPCRWDFTHLKSEEMSLPEAQVGQWGGYVFVKEAEGGPSLEEYLAPIPSHFERWKPEQCFTTKWAGKVIKANWKTCMEAFMEAYHVIATHPQIMPFTADANSKYDLYSDHVNLMITPFGLTSPHVERRVRDEQWVIDQFLKYNGRVVEPGMTIDVEPGETARQAMGKHNRARFGKLYEADLSDATDSEVQDAYTYNVFPNFSPWGGMGPQVVYRWRPWPDHEHTLMEVRLIQRLRPGEEMQPSIPMHFLQEDENWEGYFGQLGAILDQDMGNIPFVQEGMNCSKTGKLQLGNYQEIRIRHFHQTLDRYLER